MATSTLSPYYIAAAAISLAASLFLIFSYIKFRELRKHPSSIIFWRCIFDIVFSLNFIILNSWDSGKDNCPTFSFFFQFTVLGSQGYYFVLALDLLFALRNPFTNPNSNLPWYHLFVWATSLLTGLIIVGTDSTEYRPGMQICWIKSTNDLGQVNVLNWVLFFVPTIVFYAISVIIMIVAAYRLRQGLQETFKIRKKTLVNSQRYVVVFSAYWTLAAIIYGLIYDNERKSADPTKIDPTHKIGLYIVFAIVVALRGCLDVVVWVVNMKVFQAYRRWWNKDPEQEEQFTDINRALRKEVLTYSTQGICAAVEMANSLQELTDLPTTDYYPTNLTPSRENANVRFIPLEREDSETRSSVPFFDYAPEVFRFLRSHFGISDEAYKASIRGDTEAMIERFTEGASASFFYFSEDGNYIVKTLTGKESNFLLRFLPQYVNYMIHNPDSLLPKFLGFHAVRLYTVQLYFIVMQSVFMTKKRIHQRYDLKGSWVNRHAKPNKKGVKGVLKDRDLNHQLSLPREAREVFLTQIDRDAKFLASFSIMDYSLLLGIHFSKQLQSMAKDERKGTMSSDRRSRAPFFQSQGGGIRARVIEGPGIYYIGIIDVLQQWDLQKKLERFYKVYFRCKDGSGLSAIGPSSYCDRFVRFMHEITSPVPDDEELSVIESEKAPVPSVVGGTQRMGSSSTVSSARGLTHQSSISDKALNLQLTNLGATLSPDDDPGADDPVSHVSSHSVSEHKSSMPRTHHAPSQQDLLVPGGMRASSSQNVQARPGSARKAADDSSRRRGGGDDTDGRDYSPRSRGTPASTPHTPRTPTTPKY